MTAIMLVSTASSIGGMERIVCSLARGLSAEGVTVRTFFPESANAEALLRWCEDQGVVAETDPAVLDAAAPHSIRSARSLRDLIRRVDPDVVNLHYGDNFLSMWDVLGVRASGIRRTLVASIHHPTSWSRASRRKRMMTALGARMTQRITTFSAATREILREAAVPERRIRVIPCGVAVPESIVTRDEARRELDVPLDAYVVGTLARLVEYKGIGTLIDAMDCPELAGALLLVGGEGPMRAQLEEQASTSQHVAARFLGSLEDVGPLFAACDVFALPSRLEGFGLVYVEAAMRGVPSVATRVGGVPEVVLDRETGLTVELGDGEALRAALIELRCDGELRIRLGNAAKQRAMTELDETTMVRRFRHLFADVRAR